MDCGLNNQEDDKIIWYIEFLFLVPQLFALYIQKTYMETINNSSVMLKNGHAAIILSGKIHAFMEKNVYMLYISGLMILLRFR